MSMPPWSDPVVWFAAGYAEGLASEPDVPDAMQVATVDDDGHPAVRTVLLKGFDDAGFVFYTNLGSTKSTHLARRPWAAAVLHHKSQQRQLHLAGPVVRTTDAEADAYFATRPRGSQLGAGARPQSQPIDSREALEAHFAAIAARFGGPQGCEPVPRPPHWGGWRIVPERFEFWQGRRDRLHDRWRFTRAAEGWRAERLAP
jgi:pyridoxamine 5'-phosphate oxidase